MSKRSTTSKTLLFLGLLTSVGVLAACGNKTDKATTTSSSAKVVQTSSNSSAGKVQKSSTSTEGSTEASATDTSTTETTPTSSVATTFDVEAIAAGDLSTLAGTWVNANGRTVVIEGDKLTFVGEGESDPNQYHQIETHSLNESGRVGASIGFYNNGERQGGAHLSIVPAGVANILGEVSDRDHLEMGHQPTSADSGEHFFRK